MIVVIVFFTFVENMRRLTGWLSALKKKLKIYSKPDSCQAH